MECSYLLSLCLSLLDADIRTEYFIIDVDLVLQLLKLYEEVRVPLSHSP